MNEHDRWTQGERVPEPGREPAPRRGREPGWERRIVEKLALDALREQRRARRWGIFFKLFGFGYLTLVLLLAFRDQIFNFQFGEAEKHTAVVDVSGPIASGEAASANRILAGAKAALADADTAGLILRINSPGGSPVQAGRVFDEIKKLRDEHPDTPVYAVIEDICASGGYYVAAAADKIYADKASLVGSIGVRSGGFGFVDTMGKLGVERRLITAGENKAFLDPFSPLKGEEVAHMETLLDEIHQQFKQIVTESRGAELGDNEEVFSGLIWTGEQAVEIGLVDEIGSEMTIARDIFEAEKLVNYTPRDGLLDQIAGNIGVHFAQGLVARLFSPWTNQQTLY